MAGQRRKPHQFKKKKPFYCRRFFWLALLSVALIISLFYLVFIFSFFQIKTVDFTDYSSQEIEDLAWEKIRKDFVLFSSQSIFLVSLNEIEKLALSQYPQLAEVEISRKFPDKIIISATERIPFFILCPLEEEANEQNCFILDEKGIAFRQEPFSEQDLFLIKKPSLKENQPFLGQKTIKEDDLNEIAGLYFYFKENLGIELERVSIFPDKLSSLTVEGWQAYFDLNGDVKWQTEKLKALLEDKITPEKRENLEYIELRFGNFANPKYLED